MPGSKIHLSLREHRDCTVARDVLMNCSLCSLFSLFVFTSFLPGANIPPVPKAQGPDHFTHDYANVLSLEDMEAIREIQHKAFRDHDTPIIVVTVGRMTRYAHGGKIESFAREWFDTWQIGTLDRENGSNRGILILVSVGDRRARIELGADWGKDWDGHCQGIMDDSMVPRFKKGEYSAGITDGMKELAEMAGLDPNGSPPYRITLGKVLKYGAIGLGGLLVILGFFRKSSQKLLIWAGVSIAALAISWSFFAVPIFLAVFMAVDWDLAGSRGMRGGSGGRYWLWGGRSSGGSSFSGGGFGGGGFGGGFSGGGGASGGW